MKQIIFIAGILFACTAIFGQGNPSNLPPDLSSQAQSIDIVSIKSQNYILTYSYRTPLTSHPSSMTTGQMSPVIQYFDGLGRPVETVSVKGSQSGYDVIDFNVYNKYGLLDTVYLPYTKSANFGAFITKTNFKTGQNAFLTGLAYPTADVSKGYAVTEYEKSPLNRVVKQGAPGASWQLSHPVTTTYRTNATADSVKTYNYTGDTPSVEYTFPAGKLYVTETTDEDGKTVREFKDMDGKVIQKDMNGAKTRYCYDQFGRLRSVIQPTATSPTDNFGAFQYKYDSRGRLTDKKLPRVVWVYYIYDSRDRLVLTQDGVQRTKSEWTYTIYDNFNRPVEQGTWATIATRASLTTSVNGSLTYMSGQTSRIPLKYLYYDSYPTTTFSGYVPDATDYTALGATQSASDIGRQTGEKTKLLDSETGMTTWLFTAIYYDKFGRVIQTVSDNHLGGKDYVTNKYNFAGEVMQTRYRHKVGTTTIFTDTYFDLDHRGRLMKTRFKIDGLNETLLSGNSYNEAGNLAIQYLHSESGGNFLQKNDYTYNIRGWLTQTNNPTTFTENDVFGMKLEYTPVGAALYNGNISKFTWAFSSTTNRTYTYTYDGNNRITTANFNATGKTGNELDESFSYDKNGNITGIRRYDYNGVLTDSIKCTYSGNSIQSMYDKQGDVASVVDFPGSITPKSVNYDQNGNETSEPHRYIATTYNLLNLPKQIIWGGSVNRKISYFYTFNGEKLRKTVEDNGTITKVDYCGPFVYETVSGTRSLKYILTPHGRAVKSGSSFAHEYNITDHLGNVRAVIQVYTMGNPRTLQARHYYTFGMEMSQLNNGTTDNKYQYNGKEIQDDFGLYWYDYGARFYDPMLGRWHTQDPLAESYYSQSPYHFSGNNPILFVDANGMDYWSTNDPNEIARFLRSMQSGQGGFSSFDYQGWNHATDAEFTGNLTYNDESNMFYSSYGTVRDGVATSVGVSIQGILNSDNGNAGFLSEAGANWQRKSSGAVESSYPIENLLIGGAVAKPLTFLAGRLLSGIAGRFATEQGLANSGPIMRSLGAASKAEMLAMKLKLNINSPVARQVLNSLDQTVESFITTYRKGSIRSVFPGEYLNMTVEEALKSGNTTVRKLLIDGRFVK